MGFSIEPLEFEFRSATPYVMLCETGEIEVWLFYISNPKNPFFLIGDCVAFIEQNSEYSEAIAFNKECSVQELLKQYNRTCLGEL